MKAEILTNSYENCWLKTKFHIVRRGSCDYSIHFCLVEKCTNTLPQTLMQTIETCIQLLYQVHLMEGKFIEKTNRETTQRMHQPNQRHAYIMPILDALIGFTNEINGKKQFVVLPKRMSKMLPPRSSGISISIIRPLIKKTFHFCSILCLGSEKKSNERFHCYCTMK